MEHKEKLQTLTKVTLTVTFVIVVITVIAIITVAVEKDIVEPAKPVVMFLQACQDNDFTITSKIVDNYFAINDVDDAVKDFDLVLHGFGEAEQSPKGFMIVKSLDGYVEIVLLDEDNAPLYPRVGFWYELSKGKAFIKDYSIARLQPLDTRSEEYVEAWG